MPAAIAGQRGHDTTFAAACALVRFGLSEPEAWGELCEYNRRCVPPWNESELRHKLTGAFATARPDPKFCDNSPVSSPTAPLLSPVRFPVPLKHVAFDEARLATVAARGPQPANWRHWLWERSPKRPESQNALSFLKQLYRPGETVLAFDVFESKQPAWAIPITDPMDCRFPVGMREGGRGQGIWFLSNPVDGQWHPNPRQDNDPSCRSEESVTCFRYAVLESDDASAHLWLGLLAQLPIRVSAIYTSGSRSIHARVRIDVASKVEWDAAISPLKRPLKVLGVDPGALSAVRLTRLPDCRRPDKQGFQKLLYLNPEPLDVPLADLPIRFSRSESLARWKYFFPRRKLRTEAAR